VITLVIVSHSKEIAEGTAELVRGMAGEEVEIVPVGGDSEGGLGTDPDRLRDAIEGVASDGVLVFVDIGSAILSAESVLEMLEGDLRERVRLADAPLVEGAFAAGVIASTGAGIEECLEAAMEARTESKLH
jgi:dihydroxyacetone kinase phosphotransfer subunit